jgi:hypothetical protein
LGGPVFGTNYRANTDTQSPNLAQQEPSIAVNPVNPLNIVAAAKDERQGTNTKHVYIYSSTDGGVTWINQRFPYRVTVPPSSSDPVVNFSDDGICYVTALIVGGGSQAGVQVARSTDGGITFTNGAQAIANGNADKEWTWIDNFPSSPYYHNMYIAWRNFGGGPAISLNRSTDRGATWSALTGVSVSGYQFPMPVVLPNGDVIVTYLLSFNTLGYARSTDGGVSFTAEQEITPINDPQCPPDNSGCGIWRMNPIPATAVNPNNGHMVITWADGGTDSTAAIYYTRSTDNGSTWSAPAALAPPGVTNTYQIEPWVEADEQGIFHSIWYDDRENPGTSIFNIYYSRSTDSGQTWSAATRISTATSDLRIGIPASYNLAAGDYINVTASHGNVYAAWTDTRSGTGEDIYVVRGTYSGGTPTPTPTPCVPTAAWNTVSSPNISPNSNYLRAVSVAGPNDVWAVGYASGGTGPAQSIIMHWQGQNWKTIAHPSAGTSSNWLYGVHAVAPDDVWAVGAFRNSAQPAYDETLILHWNGTAWSIVPSPNPGTWNNELYAVSAAGPNEVWAVGEYDPSPSADDNTKTLTMRWNGTAWATVASPNGNEASYNSLRGVKAIVVDTENVWAVGYYGVTDGSQTLTLHWNGGAWSIVPSANGPGRFNQLLSVDATNPDDIWAVGYNNPDPGGAGNYIHTLVTHWNGTSWSQVASPNPITGASNYFDGVTAISANDAWAVGYHCTAATGSCNARTFTAHWDGSQWTEVASPNNDATFHQLHGVDAVSANDVWTVGYYGTASPGYQTLTQRYYGEPCITPSPTATRTPTHTVTATATRTVTPPATPSRTDTATSVVNPSATTAASATATPCTLIGTWSIVESPNPGSTDNYLQAVSALSPNDVWAVGYSLNSSTDALQSLIMRWNGAQWNVVKSPNIGTMSFPLYGVAAISANDVWAVGYSRYNPDPQSDDHTLVLHWNGTNWSFEASPNLGTSHNRLYAISARATNDIWAVGEYIASPGAATATLTLHWDGVQWSALPSPNVGTSDNSLRGVSAIAPNNAWAVGYYTTGSSEQSFSLRWDGSAWNIVTTANTPDGSTRLNGVEAVSANDVWAVGTYTATLTGQSQSVIERWNGTQWNMVGSPQPGSESNNLYSVSAASASDVWAVGSFSDGSAERTFIVHWDGTQWTQVPSKNLDTDTHLLRAVDVVSASDAWAVGYHAVAPSFYGTLTEHYTNDNPCPTPTATAGSTSTAVSTSAATSTRTSVPATPTSCPFQFSDVPSSNTFYANIRCLVCRGIISGYSDGTFRPNNDITRGQISKIVSQSAGFSDPAGTRIYEDVPEASPFFTWIQRLSHRGLVGGYPCGLVAGEPCIPPGSRPYFRPNASATRGQLSKIVASARGITTTPTGETYQDVPSTHTFYVWIEQLSNLGVMGGYPCGTMPSEPCGTSGKPYFRPNNNVTRGQASKIVANTFFPGCSTPSRSR